MPRYVPSPVPHDAPRGLKAWLADQLRQVSGALRNVNRLDVLTAEPDRPEDGMIVYADGVGWNPGAGAGVYARESGAWVKL